MVLKSFIIVVGKRSESMIDLIPLTLSLIFTNNIANYIDPNAGSAIAAAVIAALAGVGITVKMYWEKLKFKLAKND
jgi:hypothetical protein